MGCNTGTCCCASGMQCGDCGMGGPSCTDWFGDYSCNNCCAPIPPPPPPWCGCQEDSATDEKCFNDVYYVYSASNKYYIYITLGYIVATSTEQYSSDSDIIFALVENYYNENFYNDGFTSSLGGWVQQGGNPLSGYTQIYLTLNAFNCFLSCCDLSTGTALDGVWPFTPISMGTCSYGYPNTQLDI